MIPAYVEREFAFLLDGDRSAAAGTGSTSSGSRAPMPLPRPRRRGRRPRGPAGRTWSRPSLPGLYPERVTITDYKSSDVRDPAQARQRARDSLQLQIYAMAYQAQTGRLPDAVALHFLDSGLVGLGARGPAAARRRPAQRIREAAAGIRRRDFTAKPGSARVLVLPVPRDLPVQRRPRVSASRARSRYDAITFDFGNTLLPVDRARPPRGRGGHRPAARAERLGPFALDAFLAAWAEERERQFREEVPRFREVDIAERLVRVLARLRGMAPPTPDDVAWDHAAAARHSDAGRDRVGRRGLLSRRSSRPCRSRPAVARVLADLARDHRLAVLSNWPLATTIDRYVEAAGWTPHLAAIVVSQRVGTIKPHPAIFAAALGRRSAIPSRADPPRRRRLGRGRRRRAKRGRLARRVPRGPARTTRRCRAASATDRSSRTWSSRRLDELAGGARPAIGRAVAASR